MESNVTHKITRYVYAGTEMIRRSSSMRGVWAHDAKCSCGWESRTGGATSSYIDDAVRQHKWDVANGFWKES